MSCCDKKTTKNQDTTDMSETKTFDAVKNYYGKVLESTKDLKTSACTAASSPNNEILKVMRKVPQEIIAKFYGCGAPLPLGISGLRVLDLGSGSGRDCYICSALVGEKGFVTGVDMTEEQITVADKYVQEYTESLGFAKPNMKFVKGHIEYLDKAGISDESVDMVISNCVVNLSPDKPRVLKEVYRVLAPGGELYFSDVYCDRRLPEHVRKHEVLWGECISGALYIEDFKRIAHNVGFLDARVLSVSDIKVTDPELQKICGEANFYSITYRLFKIPGLMETMCEDYGQIATYKGTIPGHENAYQLDEHFRFEKGKPMAVCGNTAAMLGEKGISWLAPHFDIVGDRSNHYGLFKHVVGGIYKSTAIESSVTNGSSCCA
eukprot:g1244.t1